MPNEELPLQEETPQPPASAGPEEFEYIEQALELDEEMGQVEVSPEDPLGVGPATQRAQEMMSHLKSWLDYSYDMAGEQERSMAFEFIYKMKPEDRETLLQDPEKLREAKNVVLFGGEAELADFAKGWFGKEGNHLESFMTRHLPEYREPDTGTAMTELVKAEEALRLKPYRDIGGNWTVGYGHLLNAEELKRLKGGINKKQAEYLFEQDWGRAQAQAQDVYEGQGYEWDHLDSNRRDLLTDLVFNVGPAGLARYSSLMKAVDAEDYVDIAKFHKRYAKDKETGGWVDLHRNQAVFDALIKPYVPEHAMPEIEAHWQQKARKLGLRISGRSGQRTHTLGRGQTLDEVAKMYGMPVRTIMQANPNVKNRHKLKSGDTLVIPKKEK